MSDTPIPNPREITPERLAESREQNNRLRGENDRLVARIKELEEVNNDLNIFRAKHLPGGYVEA